jgi:hypothetical protein
MGCGERTGGVGVGENRAPTNGGVSKRQKNNVSYVD